VRSSGSAPREPFLRVVDGSIGLKKRGGKTHAVTVQLEVFHPRLATGITVSEVKQLKLNGVEFKYSRSSEDPVLGATQIYLLVLQGDAIRCAAVENIILAVAQNDPVKIRELVAHLAVLDAMPS